MRIFWSILFLISSSALSARALDLPSLSSPVVDEAGLLQSSDHRAIENWLYEYKKSGKAQIQVAIVKDLQDVPIEEFSIKLVEKWKLGTGQKDDGVLFLISSGDKKMRIEVGQGLEGALTDAQCKRILDDRVRPLFKAGQFGAGIAAGVSEIIKAVDPEYVGAQPDKETYAEGESFFDSRLFYFIILILFIIANLGGRGFRRRRGFYGGVLGGMAGSSWGRGGGWGGGGGWSGGGGGFSGGGSSSNW